MNDTAGLLGGILNLRTLVFALCLVGAVLAIGYLTEKNKRKRKAKPGQHLLYEVPGKTAATCRGLLQSPTGADVLAYTLEPTAQGGWYVTFTEHRPTGQVLSTVFLLAFTGDDPARLSVDFVREAFGNQEPIIPEALLDAFFGQKLGAVRVPPAAPA